MLFLLDENVSPALAAWLWGKAHDAIHLRDRDMLQVQDYAVWQYACSQSRTVVTINACDFRRLAMNTAAHPGIVVIPSGYAREEQFGFVTSAANSASERNPVGPNFDNSLVTVAEDRTVSWEQVFKRRAMMVPQDQVIGSQKA